MTTRRHFLKSTAVAIASLILPRSLFATTPTRSFFIHADSCTFWPVTNPIQWSLENQHEPILERAATGLAKLTEDDGDRIIRLVVRRCRLNLIERHHQKVTIHHWGQQGQADLRPFFKQHRLARPEITVELKDRKKEIITTKHGDDFLYGDRIGYFFPLRLFEKKFESRFKHQADDWQAAPGTWSGFAWADLENTASLGRC